MKKKKNRGIDRTPFHSPSFSGFEGSFASSKHVSSTTRDLSDALNPTLPRSHASSNP